MARKPARTKTARRSKSPSRKADPVLEARRNLAAAFRWAARLGFNEGTCNHFSLKVPGRDGHYLLNPHGLHFSEIRASDLIMVDAGGKVVEGKYPMEETAFYLHSRIHHANPDAKCVLHTHMPYATALTMIEGGRLEPALQTALRFYGRVGYDDDLGGYNGLAVSVEEGDRVCKALANHRVLFMANHGVMVAAPTVHQAFDDLYYLERAAQAQVLAMSTGRKLKLVGDNLAAQARDQILEHNELYARIHFTSLRRILDREAPDYAR